MARLVDAHGPMTLGRRPRVDRRFESLAHHIAHQQLAGRAAATIWGRMRALVPGAFEPGAVLSLSDEALRGAGLSGAKTAAIRDLALRVDRGDIRLDAMGRMSNEDIEAMLTTARGVGPWTAHMFLIFDLQRLDVWPTGDFGVRAGFGRAWELAAAPAPKELDVLGEEFRPYRSIVAWYCWRAADAPV